MKILVELDGVLRGRGDLPISTGIILSGSLSTHNRISFFSSQPFTEMKYWLDSNKIIDYDNLIDNSVALPDEDLKQRQLKVARAKGLAEMVVTSDPALWTFAFEQGIPVILFAVPAYTRPEYRPDAPTSVRSWDSITQAIAKQAVLLAEDARTSKVEELNYE